MFTPEMISGVVGIALFAIVQLSKYTKLVPEAVIIGGSIIVGILYTLFSKYLPMELQQNVVAFVSTAFKTSWMIYTVIYKGYKAVYGNVRVNDISAII